MNDISGAFGNMAMVNYPYEQNFLAHLPANPITYAVTLAANKYPQPAQD
jgi:hypothetical protein